MQYKRKSKSWQSISRNNNRGYIIFGRWGMYEVVTVSEAAKRQIIYCSRRRIGTERECTQGQGWQSTRVMLRMYRMQSGYAAPQQQGREHAARTKCDIRTGQFPSSTIIDSVTRSPSRSVSVSLAYSKAGARLRAYLRFANHDSQFI